MTASAKPRDPPILARVVITLGAPFVAWLLGRTPIDFFGISSLRTVSDLTVGLGPVAAGFLLVELVALGLPGARALRVSGPAGRARLARWGWGAATAAMLVQVVGMALFLERVGVPLVASGLLVASINIPFTLGLVSLARLVSQQGLANGYAALLSAAALPSVVIFRWCL